VGRDERPFRLFGTRFQVGKEEKAMQFQVQGQNYYLKFDPNVGRWYLLKPTLDGYSGMAVLDDGDDGPRPTGADLIPDEQEGHETVH
jgi:hypothetical protein